MRLATLCTSARRRSDRIRPSFARSSSEIAAAIGLPHEIKGHAIHAYVILRAGFEASQDLMDELKAHVSHEIGPIAKPEKITAVPQLPKTRSGKIMRRVLKARAQGLPEGDLSTLEE